MCNITTYLNSQSPCLFLFLLSRSPPFSLFPLSLVAQLTALLPVSMVNVLVQTHAYVSGDGDHMTAVSPSAWAVVQRTSIVLVPMSVGVRMAIMVAPVSFARHALGPVSCSISLQT